RPGAAVVPWRDALRRPLRRRTGLLRCRARARTSGGALAHPAAPDRRLALLPETHQPTGRTAACPQRQDSGLPPEQRLHEAGRPLAYAAGRPARRVRAGPATGTVRIRLSCRAPANRGAHDRARDENTVS